MEGGVLERLKEELKDLVKSIEEHKGFIMVLVDPENMREAALRLRSVGFDHVKSVTVVDNIKEGIFRVGYHVSSYSNGDLAKVVVELATHIPRDNPRIRTLTDVWPSAEFQEREAYEQFGVVFEGHPDLRPILLAPTVAELHPLRKDFKVVEEGIYKESAEAKPSTGSDNVGK